MRATLESHPALAGKRAAKDAAVAEREGAEWQRFPTPSVELTRYNGTDTRLLRLDQPLWMGGRIDAGITAAESRVEAAHAGLLETRNELALKVIAARTEAQRQHERLHIARENLTEHNRLLDMIKRRVQQEVSPVADLALAESRKLTSANEVSSAKQAHSVAATQLSQLAGKPVTLVAQEKFDEPALDENSSDIVGEELIQQALAASPTLRRLAREVDAAKADIEAKRALYSPQLLFRLQNSMGGIQGTQNDNRAMLVLQAQPGAGFSAASGVDAAIAKRDAAAMAWEVASREIRERVTLDWNEWQAASERMLNAEKVRTTAAEVSASYARQYVAGRKTWLDVLNAVREATQADLSLSDVRAQKQAAALRLRVLTGRFF